MKYRQRKRDKHNACLWGSPNWARTSDIMINSHALYRLSYRGTILAMTYLPSKRPASIVGAEGLNFCVRDGNRCDPFAIVTRIFNWSGSSPSQNYTVTFFLWLARFLRFPHSWLSIRLISISPLNVSPHLHSWPIYQLFSLVSLVLLLGNLILRFASRLDAFSVYLLQT